MEKLTEKPKSNMEILQDEIISTKVSLAKAQNSGNCALESKYAGILEWLYLKERHWLLGGKFVLKQSYKHNYLFIDVGLKNYDLKFKDHASVFSFVPDDEPNEDDEIQSKGMVSCKYSNLHPLFTLFREGVAADAPPYGSSSRNISSGN
jgi:hypothetical protein